MTGYDADLAYIHEVAFGDFARRAAPGLLATLRSSGLDSGLVVDLGCGAGVWAAQLIAAGYRVVGIDLSRSLIDYARRRAPEARFEVGSLFRVDLPECVAVTAIGEALSYRFDESGDLKALFHRVGKALVSGGMFVFDLPEICGARSAKRFMEGKDWALLLEVEAFRKRRLVRRSITTFRKIGRFYRRRKEVHDVRLFARNEVLKSLAAAGFEATTSRRYGACDLLPGRVAFIAKKGIV